MSPVRIARETHSVRDHGHLLGLLEKRKDGRWDVSIVTFAGPTYLGIADDLREGRRMVRDNT